MAKADVILSKPKSCRDVLLLLLVLILKLKPTRTYTRARDLTCDQLTVTWFSQVTLALASWTVLPETEVTIRQNAFPRVVF